MNKDRLLKSIKDNESLRLKPYDDATSKTINRGDVVTGFISIGYGLNLSAGITEFEADWLLEQRVQKAINQAFQLDFFNSLTSERQEVIVEMIYNLGFSGFLTFKNFIANIENGDFITAAHELVFNSNGERTLWARQVKGRADILAEKFKHG